MYLTLSASMQRKHTGRLASVATRVAIPKQSRFKAIRVKSVKRTITALPKVLIRGHVIPVAPVYRGFTDGLYGTRYNQPDNASVTVHVYGM